MSRIIRSLLVATLLVTGVREAAAAQPGSVTGQGSRGEWTATANVQLRSDGTAAGQLQIVRQVPGAKPTVCRYDTFTKLLIIVNQARLDASGICRTDTKTGSSEQTVNNHVVITDNGEPGIGADKMEVTPLGQSGVTVPGGALDAGNFQVRSAPAPSLSDLQMADMRRLRAAAHGELEVQFRDGFPRSVLGRIPVAGGDPVERARRFLDSYKDLYRLNDPDLALGVRRVSATEGDPVQTVAFFESYKGLPVFGGEIVALLKGDTLYGTVGALLRTTKIETTPEIGPRQAEDIARLFAGRRAARALGQTELMIFDPSLTGDFAPELHLAWRVTLGGGAVQELFVDAHNGNVLRQVSLEKYDFELLVDSAEHDGNAQDTTCFYGSDDVGVADNGGIYNDDFKNNPDGDHLGDACDVCANKADVVTSYGYFKDPLTGEVKVHANVPDSDGDGVPDACDTGGIMVGNGGLRVDGELFLPSNGPQPNGASHTIRVTGDPGDAVSIPIPICLGDCQEGPSTDQCIAFDFNGLSTAVHAWVTDDTAKGIGRVPRRRPGAVGFPQSARFQQRGGRKFYLNFFLTRDFTGEDTFTLVEHPCTVQDRSGPLEPLLPPPLPTRRR